MKRETKGERESENKEYKNNITFTIVLQYYSTFRIVL